jgi:hypothetical protein
MGVAGRERHAMTMYLPNPDVRPTGYEPGEFIDPEIVVPAPAPNPPTRRATDDDRSE